MSFIISAVIALIIAGYWFGSFYFLLLQTDFAYEGGLIGAINGLLIYMRIYRQLQEGYIAPRRLWLSLFLPPPILTVIGLILWGLS